MRENYVIAIAQFWMFFSIRFIFTFYNFRFSRFNLLHVNIFQFIRIFANEVSYIFSQALRTMIFCTTACIEFKIGSALIDTVQKKKKNGSQNRNTVIYFTELFQLLIRCICYNNQLIILIYVRYNCGIMTFDDALLMISCWPY
jgi:hypothetical protein